MPPVGGLAANGAANPLNNYHPGYGEGNCCGHCGQSAMVNYPRDRLPFRTYTKSGLGTDADEDFLDWDTGQIRDRVELVWDFDQSCQRAVHVFVDYAAGVQVEEREILVPRKVRVAVPVGT